MQFTNSAAMPNLTADLTALLEPARVLHPETAPEGQRNFAG